MERELSYSDMILGVRCGDMGCLAAIVVEWLIMLSPLAIIVGSIYTAP